MKPVIYRRLIRFAVFAFAAVAFFLIIAPVAGMIFKTPFSAFMEALLDREVTDSILLTFECALYATVFAFVFGTPLAYLLARGGGRMTVFAGALIDLPVMIPHTAAGIALLSLFASGPLADAFGIAGIKVMGSKTGITLGMTFVSIPFYINQAKEGFRAIDPKLEYAARSLGAGPLRVFTSVVMPLAARPMLSGGAMMWGRGISEFGAVVVLAYHPMIAPVMIYDRYTSYGLEHSRPAAVLLIVLSVFVFAAFKIISGMRFAQSAQDKRDK